MRRVIMLLLICIGAFLLFSAESCDGTEAKTQKQRNQSINTRADAFEKAQNKIPVPRTINFPQRKALADAVSREDLINHPWYTYVVADNGQNIGYFVTTGVPVNACDYLSSTEEVHTEWEGTVVLTAPSIEGIYYGGGGAAASCNTFIAFDYATNAEIRINGFKFFQSDQPLKIEVAPIKVVKG